MNLLLILAWILPLPSFATPGPLSSPKVSCETSFQSPAHAPDLFVYLSEAIHLSEERRPAVVSGASAEALKLLGLNPGGEYIMRFEKLDRFWGNFKIDIFRGSEFVYQRRVSLPPLMVWRPIRAWRDDTRVEMPLDLTLESENLHELEVGMVYEDMGSMRKYVSIRTSEDQLDSIVTVGIDVPCDNVVRYAGIAPRHMIVTKPRVLCRVPLISAAYPWLPGGIP